MWSRQMPSLLCGLFHVSSNRHCCWMPDHIWSKQMTSLLCGPFHVSSNHHCHWMPCHMWIRQVTSLLCVPFHVSSNRHCCWVPCHMWSRQMTFLLCGLFHVSAKWHSEKHHISLHTQSLSSAHSILLCLLKRHPILYSFTLRITLGAGRSLCAEILNSNGSYPVITN